MASAAEKLLRTMLWDLGVRFKTGFQTLDVTPSLVVLSAKVAVFVQDCYEDRCSRHFPKLGKVKHRKVIDRIDTRLRKAGWVIIRVWQHEIEESPKVVANRISLIVKTVRTAINKV